MLSYDPVFFNSTNIRFHRFNSNQEISFNVNSLFIICDCADDKWDRVSFLTLFCLLVAVLTPHN